jgi:hypothetical protein
MGLDLPRVIDLASLSAATRTLTSWRGCAMATARIA